MLEVIGAFSPADGAPSPADCEVVLNHANLWRKTRNGQALSLHVIERQSLTWTAAASTRTIGPSGAQLTGTRPLRVLTAKVIPVGQTTELPVDVMTHRQYAAISNKAQTSDYFHRLLYERTGATVGTITVWPVPTSAPTLLLHNHALLAAFVYEETFTVEEAYEAALVTQVAKRCAPIFGKPWTRELEELARTDWAIVQRANLRLPEEKGMPAGFPGGRGGSVSDSEYDAGII